jgi:hypothetical protein
VRTHDFPDPELSKALPYGIYDLAANAGWLSVGSDLRIVETSPPVPPTADRFGHEDWGVVIRTDVHPAGVRRQVVDAIADRESKC